MKLGRADRFGAGYGVATGAGVGSTSGSGSLSRHLGRERVAIGLDGVAEEARQIGAVGVGKGRLIAARILTL
jgi:hypothetical protein